MKKNASLLLVLILAASAAGGLASCDKNDPKQSTSSQVNSDDGDEEYVVKFNNNYDGTVIKVRVLAGQTVTLPEDPTRPGYSFEGWFLDYRQDTQNAFDATQPINSDLTVFAKWKQDLSVHIVTLHFRDNVNADQTINVNHGEAMSKPTDPTYPDETMKFTGWYTDSQCTQLFDFSTKIEANLDLYAGWKAAKATVTFNLNYTGAAEPWSVVVDLDVPMKAPDTPTREHFSFLGWFDRRVDGTKFDFANPVTSDLTLYAHWEESEFLVTFDVNGGTLADSFANTTYIAKGSSAEAYAAEVEAKLSYVGHDFKGWFSEALDANSDEDATSGKTKADLSVISAKTTVYAGWALSSYSVTFDLNYDGATGAPAAQTVKYGKTATEPTAPKRDGYIFGGWYSDSGLTSQFTFDMTVSSNLALYAKWIENAQHEDVVVTYYIGSKVHATKTIGFNTAASTNAPADPTKEHAIFAGWYTDANFTTKFNMNATLTENVNVYAKFLDRYTFEAEATDLTGKPGQGTSTNSFEQGLIHNYAYVGDGSESGVSNGYFVREMYYRGCYLEFEFTSSKAVDDAVLYLRASSESYKFATTKTVDKVEYNYLSDTEYMISVNADITDEGPTSSLKYGGLYLPMANTAESADLDYHKTPFQDLLIAENISLKEGTNYITFYVNNNNNHGGTFHAEAPIIDCIYVYSDATLEGVDYEFYLKDGVMKG